MNDRNIEDTRQPKEPPRYSPCDQCSGMFDTDDLNQIKGAGRYGDDLWVCNDCLEEVEKEEE